MSNPRIRRLSLDYERLIARFSQWAPIEVSATAGEPPEQYRVVYNIGGLYSTPSGQIIERKQHVVEINLSLGYPRRAPQCKMITPIFHPNFDDVSVCIGDFWAASEGLDDLIVRIGRMIAYQEYNVRSPLNGLAAKWAAQHTHLLPVDSAELAPPSAQTQSESAEKVVVHFADASHPDARFAPPAAVVSAIPTQPPPLPAVSTPPSLPVEPEDATFAPPSSPVAAASMEYLRLDFGSIAIALPPEKRITIGSMPGNDIQLSHVGVSGFHAELTRKESEIILRDLGSTNGTTKNAAPVTETPITPGDRICFGEVEARLMSGF
jgi:ubiquitin-protein ligase